DTGAVQARMAAAARNSYSPAVDLHTYFLHVVPESVLRSGPPHQREQAEAVFHEPCRFRNWSKVPIRVIASVEDRFSPIECQRQVARARLDKDVEVIAGG